MLGASAAVWNGCLGLPRAAWNSAICTASSLFLARASRTSSLVMGSPSSGMCWVWPLGNSSASSARGSRGQARTRSMSMCTNGMAEVG